MVGFSQCDSSFAPPPRGVDDLTRRELDRVGEVFERVARMRQGHRGDEFILEFGVDRRLNLVDRAHDLFDLGAREKVDERDARAGACRVAAARRPWRGRNRE